MMFVVKKKTLFIAAGMVALFLVLILLPAILSAARVAGAPKTGLTVVIDAGHGGIDGGVTGKATGVKESDLNLAVAKRLQADFQTAGIGAVMTRENGGGLYGLAVTGRKRRDMDARKKIIEKARPALVVSVHMNFFPQSFQRGAQVFYKSGDEKGKELAADLHAVLSKGLPASDRATLAGDYYILNCSDYPSVIVECGFLSNAEDEALLVSSVYQEKLAHNIFAGALLFLSENCGLKTGG
jgi:N-acetylmuramoyl-L-alanine amidase